MKKSLIKCLTTASVVCASLACITPAAQADEYLGMENNLFWYWKPETIQVLYDGDVTAWFSYQPIAGVGKVTTRVGEAVYPNTITQVLIQVDCSKFVHRTNYVVLRHIPSSDLIAESNQKTMWTKFNPYQMNAGIEKAFFKMCRG